MDILSEIKSFLDDPQTEISFGVVLDLEVSKDRSVLRASVSLWPDDQEIIARVTFDCVGPDSGVISFPQAGDMVVVGIPEKNPDNAIILKRMTSKEDTIPEMALDGSLVVRAISGKKNWISSDNRINLSRNKAEPEENIILGQKFKTTYINHLVKLTEVIDEVVKLITADETHTHLTIGIPSTPPLNAAAMTAVKEKLNLLKTDVEKIKDDDVESEEILSDFAFTEK